MTFRPTFWATVVAVAGIAVLIGLGTWQLDRRVWKEQLLATLAERVSAPPLSYAEAAAPGPTGIEQLEFRPVRLTGRFDDAHTFKLLSRTRNGRAGVHVVTPLVVESGTAVLVDRGWVPANEQDRVAPAPQTPLTLDGFVRRFERPSRFTPDNVPASGTWYYLDRAALAAALDLSEVAPFYVQAAPNAADPEAYPRGSVPDVALRNPHLQYAITWYALALALVVIYVVFHFRRRPTLTDGSV